MEKNKRVKIMGIIFFILRLLFMVPLNGISWALPAFKKARLLSGLSFLK